LRLSYWDISELEKPGDIVIVGAGIVGMTAAICLAKQRPRLSIEIFEKETFGTLASSRNAGFACFGSISEIYADIERYGLEQTLALVHKRRAGIKKLVERYGPGAIDYEGCGGYEVFKKASDYEKEAARIDQINLWLGSEVFRSTPLQEGLLFYRNAIINQEEGQINTGKFYALLERETLNRGIRIIRGVDVKEVDEGHISFTFSRYTDSLQKKASHVLLCTNALSANFTQDIDIVPVRNQVLVTSPIPGLSWRGTYHQDHGYIYFRNIGERILIGGARHKYPDEQTSQLGTNPSNQEYLLEYIKNHLIIQAQDVKISRSWSGILSGGTSRLPIVKRIDDRTVIAARLSGMGVAIGMGIGEAAATLLLN